MKTVISDLEISIEKNGGKVKVSSLPTLEADPLQMQQLFQNIISNALKLHQDGIAPVIKVYTDDGVPEKIKVMIEDNGIGFEEKYGDRIFEIFQRLHSREEYEGTGVGLAICRKIVERHRGKITCKSEVGKGSKFIIELPIKQPVE